jgi:hypothetical protein
VKRDVTFSVGIRAKNVTIPIKNDEYVKGNQTFSVKLLSDNPDWLQVAQPGETDITILENDGKAF